MNQTTMQALRRLLFFNVDQAARYLAASADRPDGVSARSWQMWEAGERPIPADVIAQISALCEWRSTAREAAGAQIAAARKARGEQHEALPPALVYYTAIEDWLPREARLWRPHCAVMAEIAANYDAVLVAFDPPAYAEWLGARRDGEGLRAMWAAMRLDS